MGMGREEIELEGKRRDRGKKGKVRGRRQWSGRRERREAREVIPNFNDAPPLLELGIERVQARRPTRQHLAFAVRCHTHATRAPIANPTNSAQRGGIPIPCHSPSYIRVRAIV